MDFYKTTILEKIILILIFCLLLIMITQCLSKKEGYSNINSILNNDLIVKKGNEIYDNYYVNIYDNLTYNKTKNDYEIGLIINKTSPTVQSKILDIGCGTGHHVSSFSEYNINNVIGIDNSQEMIRKAKKNYPNSKYKSCDALNSLEFNNDTFTHIVCLNQTIYYIKNKQQLLNNCYNWLISGGVLILHLVDNNKFNAVAPVAYETGIKVSNSNCDSRLTKCNVKFTTLDYKSDFKLNNNANTILKEPNAFFKENFKMKDSNKVRINEHDLYMLPQQSIINMAKNIGFMVKSQNKYLDIKYKGTYLYIFEKP